MNAGSSNVYEQWVLALRAWRADPLTDMTRLPTLDETSFPPATYNRLINHLNEAINEFMRRWNEQLFSAVGGSQDQHDLARALVDARSGLVHRLKLARHPSFPETIRNQLVSQAEIDIRSLQRQLEESGQHAASSSSSVHRAERDGILRLYRDNALTAVLEPGFSIDQPDDRELRRADRAEAALATETETAAPITFRRPQRRIFIESNEE